MIHGEQKIIHLSQTHNQMYYCTGKQNYIKAHSYGHIMGLTKGNDEGGGNHILLLITPRRNPSAKKSISENVNLLKQTF